MLRISKRTDTDVSNKIDKDHPPNIMCEPENYSDNIPVITEAVQEQSGHGDRVDARFASKLAEDNHLPATVCQLIENNLNTNTVVVSEDMQEQNKENNSDISSIDVQYAATSADKLEVTENTVIILAKENLPTTVCQPFENKSLASEGMQEQTEYSETNLYSSSDDIENPKVEIPSKEFQNNNSDILINDLEKFKVKYEDERCLNVLLLDEIESQHVNAGENVKITRSEIPNNTHEYFNNIMENNESAMKVTSLEETCVNITDFMNVNNDCSINDTEVLNEGKTEIEGNILLFDDTEADTEYSYEYMYNFLKPQPDYSHYTRDLQNNDSMNTYTNAIDNENEDIEHKNRITFADFDDLIEQFVVKAPGFGDLGLMNPNPLETVNQLPTTDIPNAYDPFKKNEDTPLCQIVSTVSISSEESIKDENVQGFEVPIVDTISINTEENDITTMNADKLVILTDSEENNGDSDYCSGYHSSDFEFISESEAKKKGLVTKKKNRSKLRTLEISRNDADIANQHNYRHIFAQFPSLNQGNHEIPEGDNYLRLFQGDFAPAIPMNFHIMENKAISVVPPNGGMAVGDAFGFDVRELTNRSKEAFHFNEETINEARAVENRIREMYPSENINRPRRQGHRTKRYV